MPTISIRGMEMPASPIRKLAPLADAAKQRGIHVFHLLRMSRLKRYGTSTGKFWNTVPVRDIAVTARSWWVTMQSTISI